VPHASDLDAAFNVMNVHGRPRPLTVKRGLLGDGGAKSAPRRTFIESLRLIAFQSTATLNVSLSAVAHQSIRSIDVLLCEA